MIHSSSARYFGHSHQRIYKHDSELSELPLTPLSPLMNAEKLLGAFCQPLTGVYCVADHRTCEVPSIHCSSCEDYIKSILSELPHLKELSINILQRSLTFVVDSDYPARTSLVQAVQRLLDTAGYPSYRAQGHHRFSFLRRGKDAAFGAERRYYERHLAHCTACQAEQDPSRAEKGEGTSLKTIQIDPRSPQPLYETKLAIEGMTCRSVMTLLFKFCLTQFSNILFSIVHALVRSLVMFNNFLASPK